jgi:hypothetical protein
MTYRHPMDKLWIDLEYEAEVKVRLSRRGIYSWKGRDIKNEMVFRLIAKIAHAYTVAEIGLGNFNPLLVEYIRYQTGDIHLLIGGTETSEVETDLPYRLSYEVQEIAGTEYIVVKVQVFASRLAPTFLAVSGSLCETGLSPREAERSGGYDRRLPSLKRHLEVTDLMHRPWS